MKWVRTKRLSIDQSPSPLVVIYEIGEIDLGRQVYPATRFQHAIHLAEDLLRLCEKGIIGDDVLFIF
jgi:hypothetical protein